MKLSLSLLLLAAATFAAEPAKPATKSSAKPTATKAAPTPEQLAAAARVQAMQEMVNAARRFPVATPEAKAFFDQLRAQRAPPPTPRRAPPSTRPWRWIPPSPSVCRSAKPP